MTYLHELIPSRADNDRVLRVGGESNTGDPLSVTLIGYGEFAVSQRIPQLNGSVTRP